MKEKIIGTLVEFKKNLKDYIVKLIRDIKEIRKENAIDFIKDRGKLLITIILLIFLSLGYIVGSTNSSKNKVLSKLEVALRDGSERKLNALVRLDGKKVKKEQLEPLINYYKSDESKGHSTIRRLEEAGETEDFILKEENKIFGTSYYIDLKTYNLKVNSNFIDGEFTIDGNNFISGGNSFIGVIPGLYKVDGKLNSEYGSINSSEEILLMKDEIINLDFQAVSLSITSVFVDAEVYINDKNTEIKVSDAKDIGPIPTDGSVRIYIENEFPWGKIKSEEVVVRDIPSINLGINMENETMKSEIMKNVNSFYSSVFEALNKEDKEEIKGATEGTKDKIFDILERKYILLKNKYTINDINIMEDKSQYSYDDKEYRATIVVEVNYDVSKSFLGLNKERKSKKFFTKVLYKNNNWIIEDVENFSL
ncbi:TcaA 3rd/4th domain-containing protein [Clostridium sp. LP20]|uniref:TcaA 3rd/4th domain-containing protein n=1 Tax=Clostridium sp. LP20 TaxID=3418665 RepID=UPI003EE578BD